MDMELSSIRRKIVTKQTRESLTYKLSQSITDKQKMVDEMDCTIQALRDELAEAEKPKLRHGDYGYGGDGPACIMIADWDNHVRVCGDVSMGHPSKAVRKVETHLGNIFDDLAVMQKDLTEFVIKNGCHIPIRCDMTNHGKIMIRQDKNSDCKMDDCWVSVHKDHIRDFIRNLRRMYATHLRRKDK